MDLIHGYAEEKRFGFEEWSIFCSSGSCPTRRNMISSRNSVGMYEPFHPIYRGHDFKAAELQYHEPSLPALCSLATPQMKILTTWHENIIRKCLELVARFPMIVAHAYAVKRHYFDYSLPVPAPVCLLAENFLHAIRNGQRFTEAGSKAFGSVSGDPC